MHGYSDRISHALAFAAKHHDQQVRRGTRLPYFVQPANVALILTRYGRPEHEVVAGILHEVVEDFMLEGANAALLEQRVGNKFGSDVVALLQQITMRRGDDAGVELAPPERRPDLLRRIEASGPAGRWVCAADVLHAGASLLADLTRTVDPDAVWARQSLGRRGTAQWFADACAALRHGAFDAPILDELGAVVRQLQESAAESVAP